MQRVNHRTTTILMSILLMGVLGITCFAASGDSTIIVIPARYRVVKLMHDLRRMRSLTVVTCQGDVNSETPELHALTGKGWSSLNTAGYMDLVAGKNVVLVGDDKTLSGIIIGASAQARRVQRIESLDIGTVLSKLHRTLKFSTGEVKRLAKRHGLSVEDTNKDLRRWGRYGKPGTKRAAETPKTKKDKVVAGANETMPPRKIKSGVPEEPKLKPVDDAFLQKLLKEKGDADEEPIVKKVPAPAAETEERLPEDK